MHLQKNQQNLIDFQKRFLNKNQNQRGVGLVNIGAATTSLVVYEEGHVLHTAVLPVGSGHITNDIAICQRTSIETAEALKLKYGACVVTEGMQRHVLRAPDVSRRFIRFQLQNRTFIGAAIVNYADSSNKTDNSDGNY